MKVEVLGSIVDEMSAPWVTAARSMDKILDARDQRENKPREEIDVKNCTAVHLLG